MNSCLYRCEVMHQRLEPKEHQFNYHLFMFYLDLDELDMLSRVCFFFSKNRFNWFSFFDRDHAVTGKKDSSDTVKTKLLRFLSENGVHEPIEKVMLLTNATVLGYGFNPISVYICYGAHQQPACAVAEVRNTHGEMKLYLLPGDTAAPDTFDRSTPKLFYVSPFVKMDASFRFIVKVPNESLHVRVDDYNGDKRFLLTSLTGKRTALSDKQLIKFGLFFPLIPMRIIFLIHWQALVLWWKKIPFRRKNADMHLQRNMFPLK